MAKPRILVIEDDANLKQVLGGVLERFGYDREIVGTGEEALALLRENRFDVAICDLYLPGLSGAALIRSLKQSQPTMPIAIISGTGPDHVEEPIDTSLYVAWLIKPFSIQSLLECLMHTLE